MIPPFTREGLLPPGIHVATWSEIEARLGFTPRRRILLAGLREALRSLQGAGCTVVYLDGSFATSKPDPADFDGAWDESGVDPDRLDPVLLDFSNQRAAQKQKYLGEMFPAGAPADLQRRTFLLFFQQSRAGQPKGLVAIDLRAWTP